MTPPKSPRKTPGKHTLTPKPDCNKTLHENECNFRTVLDQLPDLVLVHRDGTILYVNPAMVNTLGVRLEDVLDKPLLDFVTPEYHASTAEAIRQRMETARDQPYEIEILPRNGEPRAVLIRGSVVEFDGSPAILNVLTDITERKRAEVALLEGEEKFRVHVENSFDVIFTLNTEGEFVFISPAWERHFGYHVSDGIGKSFAPFVHPDDIASLAEYLKRVLITGQSEASPAYRVRHADGRWLWFVTNGTPYVNAKGERLFIGVGRNITERKLTEEVIGASEEKYRILFTQMTEGSALHELVYDGSGNPVDYRILDVNPAFGSILGLKPEDVIGKTSCKVYRVDIPPFFDIYTRVVASGRPEAFEVYFAPMKKHFAISVYSPGAGKFATIFEDITERKRAEEAVQKSEEKFRAFFTTSRDCVFITTPDGSWLDFNDAAVALFGYESREDLIRIKIPRLYANPDERDAHIRYIRENGFSFEYPVDLKKKDGTIINALITTTTRKDASGTIIGFQGSIRDITEQKRTEKKLREGEEKFREIFNKINDAVHIHDLVPDGRPGRFLDVNDAACRMLGITRDEFLAHNPLDYATEYHNPPLEEVTRQLRTTGNATFETGQRRTDGSVIPVEINAHVITLMGKTVVLSVIRDITERKRVEEALRDSKQILEGILNTIPVRVFWKDKNLNYLGCNVPFARDAGFEKPEDIIGKDDYSMGWREQAELYRADDRSIIESGKPKLMIEEPQTTPTGETIYLYTNKMPLLDARGDGIGVLGTYLDVTERRRAEEAVRESRQLFADIISFLPDATFVIDSNGKVLAWNRALEQLSGISADCMIGRGDYEYSLWQYGKRRPILIDLVLHPEEVDGRLNYSDIVFSGSSVTAQMEIILPDSGQKKSFFLVASPLIDSLGKTVGAIESIRDISRLKEAESELARINQNLEKIVRDRTKELEDEVVVRKKAEAKQKITLIALTESERKYHTLFDKTKDAYLIIENNKFVDCNTATLQMLGFATKDELFQIHPSQLSPPAQPDGRVSFEKAEEMMAKAKRDGSHRFEWVHRRASGEDFWVEVSLTAIPMQDHYIIHTAWRDITDRKNAEAAILEEREFSDAVLESVPGLLYLYDDQGKLRRWNRQHETLTGYSAEELAGMNLLDWFRHDERSMADVREGIERTFREGHGSTEGNLITKSGKVIPFYFTATTLDLKGHTYFTGIGIDITDRKKAESAIQASLDEKVVLLREIHHRVKNNLQIIISLVNLQMRQSEDPEVRQIMAETQNRVRAMSLVHEKLYGSESLSRIDFGDYTRYLAKQLSSFFGSDSMKVRLDISLGRIMVDINTAVPLGLIMNELISNSLKHAFPGGREGTIAISGTVDNNVITFVVRDNGIGIPEDLDWKNTPSLGMHLITRLVEQVDGTITLDRNEGTEFTLTVKRGQSSGGSG